MTTISPAFILLWIICGLAAWRIGRHKGFPYWGLAWGLLLGIVGVIVMACWPKTRAKRVADARDRLAIEDEASRAYGGQSRINGRTS